MTAWHKEPDENLIQLGYDLQRLVQDFGDIDQSHECQPVVEADYNIFQNKTFVSPEDTDPSQPDYTDEGRLSRIFLCDFLA